MCHSIMPFDSWQIIYDDALSVLLILHRDILQTLLLRTFPQAVLRNICVASSRSFSGGSFGHTDYGNRRLQSLLIPHFWSLE